MKNERRRRFIAFFDQRYRGDRARLIQDTGLTKGRVSQLFDPNQPFGEVAARRLAEQLDLPPDYFERDQAAHQGAAITSAATSQAKSEDRWQPTDARAFVTWFADRLDTLDDAGRERVAQRLQTLAHAPDSQRARDALVAELAQQRADAEPARVKAEYQDEVDREVAEAEERRAQQQQQRHQISRK